MIAHVTSIRQYTNTQAYNYIISKYEHTRRSYVCINMHKYMYICTEHSGTPLLHTFAIFAGHILIFIAVQMSGHTLCHEDGRKVGSQATALHGCSKLRGNSHVLVARGTGAMGISHCTMFQFHIMLFHDGVRVIPAFTKGVALWPYICILWIVLGFTTLKKGHAWGELPLVSRLANPLVHTIHLRQLEHIRTTAPLGRRLLAPSGSAWSESPSNPGNFAW